MKDRRKRTLRRALLTSAVGIVLVPVMTLMALPMAGCQRATDIDLSFETIERVDFGGTVQLHEGKEPKLVVIVQQKQVNVLGSTVSVKARTKLESLDFDHYFAVAVFQGYKPTLGYGVEVQRIARAREVFIIYAHFSHPEPGQVRLNIVTSPYHLVKMSKENLVGKEVEFVLLADGAEVARQAVAVR